ncbi:MAG: hypothetical protein HY791_19475 [Deltaproteobacteria bacterium]|nr:hypothetical protein [Deltaproteobacteria bacterium]
MSSATEDFDRLVGAAAAAGAANAVEVARGWQRSGVRLVSGAEVTTSSLLVPPASLWVHGELEALRGRPWVAVVCSRQGREVSSSTPWVRSVCSAIARLPENSVVVTGVSELPQQVIRAAARERELPVVSVLLGPLDGLEASVGGDPMPVAVRGELIVSVLPPFCGEISGPARDAVVLGLAEEVVGVSVRPGGNWSDLLNEARRRAASLGREAKVWEVREAGVRGPARGTELERSLAGRTVSAEDASVGEWHYLTHLTRRPIGPWPDESEGEFLRALVRGQIPRARTARDTLARIAVAQRVVGGSKFLRAGRAVCLTELRPSELLSLGAQHRGLGRPRYEPFGVAFLREDLERLGARPVIYGVEATWESLPESERWRFQAAGQGGRWVAEREWRVEGDLDFRGLARVWIA